MSFSPAKWFKTLPERNTTEWSVFMKELTTAGNTIARLRLEVPTPTLDGAHVSLFNSHSLLADIYAHPELYLNGTASVNVTGSAHACVLQLNESVSDPGVCTDAVGTDQDSYLWYDELHPSQQTDRVVAKAISDVIHTGGRSSGSLGCREGAAWESFGGTNSRE